MIRKWVGVRCLSAADFRPFPRRSGRWKGRFVPTRRAHRRRIRRTSGSFGTHRCPALSVRPTRQTTARAGDRHKASLSFCCWTDKDSLRLWLGSPARGFQSAGRRLPPRRLSVRTRVCLCSPSSRRGAVRNWP